MSQKQSKSNKRKVLTKLNAPNLTKAGRDFLSIATASPDFAGTVTAGVPDLYCGKTLTQALSCDFAFSAPAGVDTYILCTPSPTIPFYVTSAPTGLAINVGWTGVEYPDKSLFLPKATSNVTSFRHVAFAAEIQCMMNQMTWAGSITCWKLPVKYNTLTNSPTTSSNLGFISGLTDLNVIPDTDVYTNNISAGAYAVSMNRDATFAFKDIQVNDSLNNITNDSGVNFPGTRFTGIDDFDSIVFKLSVPAGAADQAIIIRTWATIEYTPVTSSAFYHYAMMSPDYDLAALLLYRKIMQALPIAVPQIDNENFWKRVLQILQSAGALGSVLPGPYGQISRGVNLTSGGILSLLR